MRSVLYGFSCGEAYGRAIRENHTFPHDAQIDNREPNSWGDHTDHIFATIGAIHTTRHKTHPVRYDTIYRNLCNEHSHSNKKYILRTHVAKALAITDLGMHDFAGVYGGVNKQTPRQHACNTDAIPRAIVAGCLGRFRNTETSKSYMLAIHMCKLTHNTVGAIYSAIFVARVISAIIYTAQPLVEYAAIYAQAHTQQIKDLANHSEPDDAVSVFASISQCIYLLKCAEFDKESLEDMWRRIVGECTRDAKHPEFVGGLVGAVVAGVLGHTPEWCSLLAGATQLEIHELFIGWCVGIYTKT